MWSAEIAEQIQESLADKVDNAMQDKRAMCIEVVKERPTQIKRAHPIIESFITLAPDALSPQKLDRETASSASPLRTRCPTHRLYFGNDALALGSATLGYT